MHLEDRGVGAKRGAYLIHLFVYWLGCPLLLQDLYWKRTTCATRFIKKGNITRRFAPRSRTRCELVTLLVASLLAAWFATAVPAAIYCEINNSCPPPQNPAGHRRSYILYIYLIIDWVRVVSLRLCSKLTTHTNNDLCRYWFSSFVTRFVLKRDNLGNKVCQKGGKG